MALGGGVGRPCKDTIIKRAKIEPNSHLLFMPFLRAQHFVDFFRKKMLMRQMPVVKGSHPSSIFFRNRTSASQYTETQKRQRTQKYLGHKRVLPPPISRPRLMAR